VCLCHACHCVPSVALASHHWTTGEAVINHFIHCLWRYVHSCYTSVSISISPHCLATADWDQTALSSVHTFKLTESCILLLSVPQLTDRSGDMKSLWTTVVRRWVGTVTDWYQNQMLSYYISRMPVCPSACRWHCTLMHAREWRHYKRQVQQFSAGFNGQSMKNLDPWHHPCYNWIYVITMRDVTELQCICRLCHTQLLEAVLIL